MDRLYGEMKGRRDQLKQIVSDAVHKGITSQTGGVSNISPAKEEQGKFQGRDVVKKPSEGKTAVTSVEEDKNQSASERITFLKAKLTQKLAEAKELGDIFSDPRKGDRLTLYKSNLEKMHSDLEEILKIKKTLNLLGGASSKDESISEMFTLARTCFGENIVECLRDIQSNGDRDNTLPILKELNKFFVQIYKFQGEEYRKARDLHGERLSGVNVIESIIEDMLEEKKEGRK